MDRILQTRPETLAFVAERGVRVEVLAHPQPDVREWAAKLVAWFPERARGATRLRRSWGHRTPWVTWVVPPAHGRRVGCAGRTLGASATVCFLWARIVRIHLLLAWVEST